MKTLFPFILVLVILTACNKDDSDTNVEAFDYIVSGSAQANIVGDDCRFGASTNDASSFITLNSGMNDVLTFKILLEDLVPGDYLVNAGFVNGNFQPSMPGDATGELQLGSVFSGNKFYNTSSGDGGRVTITSLDGEFIKGNFQVHMLELVGGTAGSEPTINVAGNFTAIKQ